MQILLMLDGLRGRLGGIIECLRTNPPQEGLKIIAKNVAMAGPFLSGQILLDATYAGDIVPYSGNDFLIVGPGAHWGLNLIFEKKLSKKEADEACRRLYGMQKEEFNRLAKNKGLDWQAVRWQKPDYPNAPYLCLVWAIACSSRCQYKATISSSVMIVFTSLSPYIPIKITHGRAFFDDIIKRRPTLRPSHRRNILTGWMI